MKKNSFLLLSYTIGVLKLPLLSLAQDATVYTECYPNGCCHPDGCSTTPLDCSAADEHCTESCETILDCSSNVCKFNTELQDCEIVDSDGNAIINVEEEEEEEVEEEEELGECEVDADCGDAADAYCGYHCDGGTQNCMMWCAAMGGGEEGEPTTTECYRNLCCHPDGCSTTPLDCSSAADEYCTMSCETILDCSSNVCKFNTELQDCEIVDSDGNPVEAAEASCDMLLCAPNHQLIDTDERGCGGTCQPSCVPNCESWFDGCNTCQCDEETNLVTSCTKMFCEDHNYAHSYCLDTSPPSQGYCPEGCVRWYDGCNTCKCGGGEFGGYCTEMACSQQQQPRCNQWEGHKPDSDPDNSTNLSDFDLFGELNAPSARMMVGSFVCMMSVMGFMSIHFQ